MFAASSKTKVSEVALGPAAYISSRLTSTDSLFSSPRPANAEALKEMLGDSEGEGTVQLSR